MIILFMQNNVVSGTSSINCNLNFSSLIHSVVDTNTRGDYHQFHVGDCYSRLNQKYVYLHLGEYPGNISASFGLCVPETCSDNVLTKEVKSVLSVVEPSLRIFKINSNLERYVYSYNWVSVLTVFIMLFSLIMILFAIFKRKGQKQENKLLKCFDPIQNLKNFRLREGEPLIVLDGVRALTMVWVVFVHIYTPSFRLIASKINEATHYKKPFNLLVLMGFITMDIFMCLGGFFLMFVTLRQKQITIKFCISSLFKRISRIWPVFVFIIMIYYSIFPAFGLGPKWKPTAKKIANCQNPWKSLLLISNVYTKGYQHCLASQWYLQVDFQLFSVVTFLMLIYHRNKKLFLSIIFALLITVAINDFFLITKSGVTHSAYFQGLGHTDYQLQFITMKPYIRCLAYLVGVIIGSFYMDYRLLFKAKKDVSGTIFGKLKKLFEESTFARRAFECCGLAIILAYTLSPRYLQIGGVWPQWAHSFYWVSVKIVFPFAVMMVACPSMLGCKSLVSVLLRSRILVYLARVSFSTFLIHTLIVDGYFNRIAYDNYFNMVVPFNIFCGILVLSVFCGFILMMTIELPFAGLIALAKNRFDRGNQIKNPKIAVIQRIADQTQHALTSEVEPDRANEEEAQKLDSKQIQAS